MRGIFVNAVPEKMTNPILSFFLPSINFFITSFPASSLFGVKSFCIILWETSSAIVISIPFCFDILKFLILCGLDNATIKNTNDISKIVQNFVYLPYIDTIVDFASKNLITIIDNKKSTLADFYENTAKLYKEYGNYKKALLLYKNVLKINEGIKTKENLVPIYNNLSEIYQIMGKFETAQVYNEKIVKLQDRKSVV